MAKYCVNKNKDGNGDHEVHKKGCPWWPSDKNRKDLGEHLDCHSAIKEARKYYSPVNGHKYCCEDCHTS